MSVALQHGSPVFPEAIETIPASSQRVIDAAIADLVAHKDAWVATPVACRIELIERLTADFQAIVPRWVGACIQAKGLHANDIGAGDEWAAGSYPVLRNLRLLRDSLRQIERRGVPRIPGRVTTLANGQVSAQVFPSNTYDRLLFGGLRAEVWMQPGVTKQSLPETMALAYKGDAPQHGAVAVVLGAGNVASIGPMDMLYKLFVENRVVLYKPNPVNEYTGPLMEEAFRVLVDEGFLRVVYGGVHEGEYLCQHDDVDEIHITGSDKTFEAIVFGAGPEGAARKAANQPRHDKRVTGELGNVSPVIVVPGPWSPSDIAYHAAHIASMLTNNAGFNCNATRIILQHAAWPQRGQLLNAIRDVLAKVPPRAAYYPGASERMRAFVEAHPEAEQYGEAKRDQLPWTLIPGTDASALDDIVYTTEAFCGLFAETPLQAPSVPEFIDRAAAFANENVWGTLNVTLLVHPQAMTDPPTREAVARAIATLRYGTIGVNYWGGAGFILGSTTWGAFPGHPLTDIQSGNDVVHNTLMFASPQKSVLRAPFRITPVPPWFVTRASVEAEVFSRLGALEASPSPAKLPGILRAALRR